MRLICWILLLKKFDLEIKDWRGADNFVVDHMSKLVLEKESLPISETLPDEQLSHLQGKEPWFANIVNLIVTGKLPNDLNKAKEKKIKMTLSIMYGMNRTFGK